MADIDQLLKQISDLSLSYPRRARAAYALRESCPMDIKSRIAFRSAMKAIKKEWDLKHESAVLLLAMIPVVVVDLSLSGDVELKQDLEDLMEDSDIDVAATAISISVMFPESAMRVTETLKKIALRSELTTGDFSIRGLAFRALAKVAPGLASELDAPAAKLECIEILKKWMADSTSTAGRSEWEEELKCILRLP